MLFGRYRKKTGKSKKQRKGKKGKVGGKRRRV